MAKDLRAAIEAIKSGNPGVAPAAAAPALVIEKSPVGSASVSLDALAPTPESPSAALQAIPPSIPAPLPPGLDPLADLGPSIPAATPLSVEPSAPAEAPALPPLDDLLGPKKDKTEVPPSLAGLFEAPAPQTPAALQAIPPSIPAPSPSAPIADLLADLTLPGNPPALPASASARARPGARSGPDALGGARARSGSHHSRPGTRAPPRNRLQDSAAASPAGV